jgi:hypothetical protein
VLELAMCWKCEQIDRHIEHYRGLFARTTDEQSGKSLEILIARLEENKRAVHIVEFKPPEKTAPSR